MLQINWRSNAFLKIKNRNNANKLRLKTSILLRWLAVIGQSISILIVHFILGFKLPLIWCFIPIILSANLNITLAILFPTNLRLPSFYTALLFTYDLCQLATIFYFTGGLQNPFMLLFIVPVSVSATILPRHITFFLAGLTVFLISFLGIYHEPLPWLHVGGFKIPNLYLVGIWCSLVVVMVFLTIYIRRISYETHSMFAALSATELMLEREQKLSALDGLAAAAAHELGSPLSTITLVAKELKHELKNVPNIEEDLELLVSQATRCRKILSELQSRKNEVHSNFLDYPITEMMDDLISNHRMGDVDIKVIDDSKAPNLQPKLTRNAAFLYALGNLINNAAEFANERVLIELNWDAKFVNVHIADDGLGFSEAVLDKLGEPFISTREANNDSMNSGEHHGMGLGLFIAKTVLERSGAQMLVGNYDDHKIMKAFSKKYPNFVGAHVFLKWRRIDFETIGSGH